MKIPLLFAAMLMPAVLGNFAFASSVRESPIEIASGFEFMGVADGKVFVIPIKAAQGSDDLTYQDAIARCAAAGYRIATIETEAQNEILKPYVFRTSSDDEGAEQETQADKCTGWRWSWIDGVDFQAPGNFFSINSGKNLTYFDWVRGWPVQTPLWNCIRVSCNGMDGTKWWNVPCTQKLSVICETSV